LSDAGEHEREIYQTLTSAMLATSQFLRGLQWWAFLTPQYVF